MRAHRRDRPPSPRPRRGMLGLERGEFRARFFRHGFGDVRIRPDRDEHRLAVLREGDVARPMPAPAGQRRHDDFGLRRRGQIAAAVGVSDDLAGCRDINISRVRPRRIERDAEGAVGSGGEDVGLRRRTIARGAQNAYASGAALRDEDIAVGRDAHNAGFLETAGEKFDMKARGRLRGGPVRSRRHARGIRGWLARERRRHVLRREFAANSRRMGAQSP